MRDLVIGRRSLRLFWVLLSCAVCTHNWDAARPAAGQLAADSTRVYRVTIIGATIDGSRPDGSPWNTKKPNKTWTFIGIAAGLAVGQATIGKEVGSWLDGDAQAYPPAPLVEINVGGAKYETAALEPTLSPEWNQDLLLDLVSRLPTEPVVIIVRDGIDGKVVGSTTMTVEALISRDAHTITNIPSVPSLNLRVAATTINRATFAVVVPGNGQATLDVSGGDVVEIVASNQVCVAPDRCHGPDGDPQQPGMSGLGQIAYYRDRPIVEGFSSAPHGSLVGLVSKVPVFIGQARTVHVPSSGTLQMFVNDGKPEDNSGFFELQVSINPCHTTVAPLCGHGHDGR